MQKDILPAVNQKGGMRPKGDNMMVRGPGISKDHHLPLLSWII